MNETLYSIFSSMPFCICLGWWIILLLRRRTVSSPAHVYLASFAFTCMILGFCHAGFYNGEEPPWLRIPYVITNLAAYPLLWLYTRALTEPELLKVRAWWVLLPTLALGVALTVIILCGGSPHALDLPIRVLFLMELIVFCWSIIRRLTAYDRRVHNFYADTENKSPRILRSLFFLLIPLSVLTILIMMLGRALFSDSLLLIIPSLLFCVLLFGFFHVGFLLEYTAAEMAAAEPGLPDFEEEVPEERAQQALLQRIRTLMESQQFYLTSGLKISDVAEALGTNRTYISSCINRQTGMSFSDYVNGFRVRHAQDLIRKKDPNLNLSQVGAMSGFSGDTSFFRNFRKVTGQTPSEWLSSQ